MEIAHLLPHLIEFRKCLIRCAYVTLIIFLCLFFYDEKIYSFIAKPLLAELPEGSAIIATEVTSPFIIPMKLALILAFFIAIPFIIYQLWSFIGPGLYKQEKKKVFPFMIASTSLFYIGMVFAYFLICPLALSFFAKCAPQGVSVMTDIRSYLNFVLSVIFSGGIAFQVPVITVALVKYNLVSIEKLVHLRPYIIVLAFIVGMILTPPDVVSQILLALPMWGLFELGLLLAKYMKH
jgi:sec-independent protein translocase protein TatC